MTLPEPPNSNERRLYVTRHLRSLELAATVSFAGITYGLVRLSISMWWGAVLLAYCALTLVTFVVSLFSNYFTKDFDLELHDRFVRGRPFDHYPSIDVWLPNCGESLEILENTWKWASQIVWPGPITYYCLDDRGLKRVKALAERFNFVYLSRPDKPWMKKSGNLHFAFNHSDGDFILLLDADFCPRPDILFETIPYFLADDKLAIVQTAQYFRVTREQNWIQKGGAQLQEYFYRAAQWSRQLRGAAVCCGTNAVYRRAALEENGGMTLVPQGEDMRTGFDLGLLGWKLLYLPIILASGLCPADLPSYFKQQYRWCTGSLRLLSLRKFWRVELAEHQRLCYIAGFNYYLITAAYTLVIPSVIVSLLLFSPHSFHLENYMVLLPAMLFILVVYPLWHRSRYGPAAWSAKIVCQWSYIFAIWDFLMEQTIPWDATGSGNVSVSSSSRFRQFAFAAIGWNGLTSVAWLGLAMYRSVVGDWRAFVFVAFMGVFYVTNSARVIRSLFGQAADPPSHAMLSAVTPEPV